MSSSTNNAAGTRYGPKTFGSLNSALARRLSYRKMWKPGTPGNWVATRPHAAETTDPTMNAFIASRTTVSSLKTPVSQTPNATMYSVMNSKYMPRLGSTALTSESSVRPVRITSGTAAAAGTLGRP